MLTKRLFAAIAVACALAAAGCTETLKSGPPATSSTGWGQIAVGVGQVIGKPKADEQVAKASAELAKYCGALQAVALGATIFAPEKQRVAAAKAAAVVNTVCANPPADVATALITVADAYEAARAAGI